jgi:hypothetical protein
MRLLPADVLLLLLLLPLLWLLLLVLAELMALRDTVLFQQRAVDF